MTARNLFGLIVVADQSMIGWTAGLGSVQRTGEDLSLSMSCDHADPGTLDLPTCLPTGQTKVVDIDLKQVGMNMRWQVVGPFSGLRAKDERPSSK